MTPHQKYDKQYLKFKEYIRNVNEGKRALTERSLESALECLGEVETFELSEGGIGFVPFGYKMAKDDEVVSFIYITAFYDGLIVDTLESSIKELDEELVWHLLDLFEQALKTPCDIFHSRRRPDFLITRLLGIFQQPSFTYYGRCVPFSEESKKLLIKVIEHLATFIEDDFLCEFVKTRVLLIEYNDKHIQTYWQFVEECIGFLYNSKTQTEKRTYSFEENKRLNILSTVISDFCFVNRCDLAYQLINSIRDYSQTFSERLERHIK